MVSLCATGSAQPPPPGRCAGLSQEHRGVDQKRTTSVLGSRQVPPQGRYDWVAARHGQNLNPRRIAEILAQADSGYMAAWHDLLNECRQKDGEMQSMLSTREESLIARGWSVSPVLEPGQRQAGARAKRNADFCRSALESIRDLNASLSHLQDARYKNFSACETEWTKNRKGDVVPLRLHTLQGRRWVTTTDNRIEFYDDGRVNPARDLVGAFPWRFVVHKPRTNGDVLSREGLGRCLVWFSAFGAWSLRDWLLFAELFGKPWRLASYEGVNYDEDKEAIVREILDNMTASTYAILPQGIKLDIAWPQSPGGQTQSPNGGILQYCRAVKALVILGQQATTGDVQGGLGGKGDARHEVRMDLESADDKALSEAVRWQLLGPILWLKYGTQEIPPLFRFNTAEALDVKAWLESVKIVNKDLGLPVSRAQIYDVTGLHEPLSEEDAVGTANAENAEGDGDPEEPSKDDPAEGDEKP